MRQFDCLIVGAGHAGAQAAQLLRQKGFAGSIGLLGEEQHPPYERPPLSKDYLAGDKTFDRILIRPEAFWAQKDINLVLGVRVESVDPQAKTVQLNQGETLRYGVLIWAAGGAARKLSCPGSDLGGVHVVRNRDDVDVIMADLDRTTDVVVIGGGYIGLEAAAVLSKFGKAVTVLEMQDRVLARVAGEPLSRFYEAEHRAHGVDIRLGARFDELVGEDGRVTGVRLADDSILPAQMVIVGIGIVPAVGPLLEAGAEGGNGVDIDDHCRTSLPDIYAIGDCAAHHSAFCGDGRLRVESVQNANDQALTAVRTIMSDPEPYTATPWFWSNQYDLRLQTVGLSVGYDDAVVRGDPAARTFSVIYLRNGRVIALDCVNATKDYVQGKRLVVEGLSPPVERLRDSDLPLKEIVA